jgi:hypothetical protein
VTDLQALYSRLRSRGLGHHAALRSLAETVGVDEDCIKRQLERARTEDARPPERTGGKTDDDRHPPYAYTNAGELR